jgi:hypothetical protein
MSATCISASAVTIDLPRCHPERVAELRVYIPPGLITTTAREFCDVWEAAEARYRAVEHGTSERHDRARRYFAGMIAACRWICGVDSWSPLSPTREPLERNAENLMNLLPLAGLAELGRPGYDAIHPDWAQGVGAILHYAHGWEIGRDLPRRLGIRTRRADAA